MRSYFKQYLKILITETLAKVTCKALKYLHESFIVLAKPNTRNFR